MPQFRFSVPGEPKGKARARTFFDPRVNRMVSKTPDNTVLYENLVKMCYQSTSHGYRFPDDTPLQITVRAFFSIPKRTPKKRITLLLANQIRPTKKPDIDNITKAVLDALNGVAYKDDAAIVQFSVEKYYSYCPRVDVIIGELEAPQNG